MISRGKKFEKQFEQDWRISFPKGVIIRLPDQQSGYFGTSQNPCDFICYKYPKMFMLELKSHEGNTFPISCLRQYNKLITYKDKEGLNAGVIIWFIDHDKVIYAPITTFEKLIKDNKKSLNIVKDTPDKYFYINIPSVKKRTFLSSNYTVLCDMEDLNER